MPFVAPRAPGQAVAHGHSTIYAASVVWRKKPEGMLVKSPSIELLPDGSNGPRRFKIKVVDTAERRGMVDALLKSRYAWRGYKAVRLPTELSVHKFTLAATQDAETIGSITVSFDGPERLSADDAFGDEVDALRAQGHKVCEFQRLAVDPIVGTKRVLAALFHVAYIVAYRIRGHDTLLVEVNPRHVHYYERMLGFKTLGEERINRSVHAPAVLLSVDFAHIMRQIGEFGGHPWRMATERSLYPAAFSLTEEAAIISRMMAKQRALDEKLGRTDSAFQPSRSDFMPSDLMT
jgi:hypothetical protein